ncbi:outer membrane beta-barrel protein [Polaribacter sp. SA4-12]|uniref:outer membrane beta-barrel protein n=1 Tax=Polaribacter sp. SA4-12 TaxID=1312072 RepID=UPI000B3C7691|nr:outer membrane beta-barrel protein [Polaribacter sp. SA4-12]ARV15886.1 hypothetical protein BTO07_12370 [Polaribacter sp. SA4-12]
MDQNNLDKLFQEQLKNLEVTPSDKVWNNIESKLKKKKRRGFPIWWFTSGIAAMLVLGMLIFPFSNDENNFIENDSVIITTESTKKENKLETIYKTKIDSVINHKKSEDKILVADEKMNLNQSKSKKKTYNKKELVSEKSAVKKIFIADNSFNETIDSSEDNEKVISKTEKVFPDEEEKIIKDEISNVQKKSIVKKLDINNFVKKNDSVFSTKILKNKWSIAPVFAVLNSNSFSNSSPLEKSLSNSTEGKSSFSYGFQIGYKINKKWSIQSGIHLQEMSYANNQVTATPSISKSESSVTSISGGSFSFDEAFTQSSDFASNSLLKTNSLNGQLNQTYGYIEIPIEVKYNFLSANKFNTQIVAGFSSLFLNKNEVNLKSQFLSKLGKATNLNTINFSGNLGFDFNYSLNSKWSLNLNPMFKAQLNTFSEKSNGFAPFNLGIYSGIKYTF